MGFYLVINLLKLGVYYKYYFFMFYGREMIMRKFFWFILLLVVFSGLVQISFAGNKKFCKIGGKKINVGDITLSTDFFPEKKYVIATAQYTFYLDSNALRIDMKNIDRYLHSKNSYYVMAAILLQYVNTVYPDKPCPQGRKVCSKEVCLSVNNFFEYLNNNPEIKKKLFNELHK